MNNEKNPMICNPETGFCEADFSNLRGVEPIESQSKKGKLKLIYFTDPICSSCWGIEPQLRKLKLEYGHILDFEYHMGGLLPNWNYNSGGISNPADVAKHWDEASKYYEMPIDGDIWLENPLSSSYPPSRAFKAAQLQDKEKAIAFLRYLRILLFVEKKNIIQWRIIEKAARINGLDEEELHRQIRSGKAEELLQEDLRYAKSKRVRGFPSIFIKSDEGIEEFIYGFRPYAQYEEMIHRLKPGVEKLNYERSLENLFANFRSLTAKEFSILKEIKMEEAIEILENTPDITKLISKNGNVYFDGEMRW